MINRNDNWSYLNKRYYNFSLKFKLIWTIGLFVFIVIKIIDVLLIVVPRHFSHSYDITLILMMIFPIVIISLAFRWVWKIRYHFLNPSFRMNRELIEIDRKQKEHFYWKDVEKIIITGTVENIGILHNIEREAIIFKLKNGEERFLIIGKGIYICEFDKFMSLLNSYVHKDIILYSKKEYLDEYRQWVKKFC